MQATTVMYLCWVCDEARVVGTACVVLSLRLLPETVSRGTASLCTAQSCSHPDFPCFMQVLAIFSCMPMN